MYKILLFKFTSFDSTLFQILGNFLRNIGFDVRLSNEIIHLNASMFNWDRLQYDGEKVISYINERYSSLPYDSLIGIGCIDAYKDNEDFIITYHKGKIGLVFTYRLKDSSIDKFLERVKKEVLHEIGHTLGLDDCKNPYCVMKEVKSVKDVDSKGDFYCTQCLYKLNINNKR